MSRAYERGAYFFSMFILKGIPFDKKKVCFVYKFYFYIMDKNMEWTVNMRDFT